MFICLASEPKVSRRLAAKLVEEVTQEPSSSSSQSSDSKSEADNESNKGTMTIYINDLIDVVKQEIMYASRQDKLYNFTQRAERMLRKASAAAITGAVQDMFDAWVDRMEDLANQKEAEECVSTPEIVTVAVGRAAAAGTITRRINFETPNNEVAAPFITPHVDLTDDVEADERDVDLVLTRMREQTVLQNLLHKSIVETNQRTLILEHKNGRKLRLFVPPDSKSTKSYMEEASKSQWINHMLHSDVQRKGLLMYLAKTQPGDYLKVAKQKKLHVAKAALTTPQTMALGRLTGINNTQMSKLRSFLHVVGHADLKLYKADIARIDQDVGLHVMMPSATFDNYTLEWSSTAGHNVSNKAPEHCSFWNSDLLVEVASEIDLLFHTMFTEKLDLTAVTSLDYGAPGFAEKPGIVVLFGGDYGAGNCPCSLKLNFSSPQERKARGELNWRCPTIQIASIECTKDTYELLNSTIMPRIKSQILT